MRTEERGLGGRSGWVGVKGQGLNVKSQGLGVGAVKLGSGSNVLWGRLSAAGSLSLRAESG